MREDKQIDLMYGLTPVKLHVTTAASTPLKQLILLGVKDGEIAVSISSDNNTLSFKADELEIGAEYYIFATDSISSKTCRAKVFLSVIDSRKEEKHELTLGGDSSIDFGDSFGGVLKGLSFDIPGIECPLSICISDNKAYIGLNLYDSTGKDVIKELKEIESGASITSLNIPDGNDIIYP